MSTLRILLLVLSLALVAFLAKYMLTGSLGFGGGRAEPAAAAPTQTLDRVREQAHQIEGELKKNAERGDAVQDQDPGSK
jgi:hypothetical protein